MATKKKRQGTGTETTVSPTKSDIDSLEVPALSLNLDEKMDVAAALLISLVQTYVNDSKKEFTEEDFEPLFADEALGQIRFFTQRWKLFLQAIERTVSLVDPEFPLVDFITDMLTIELSPKTKRFLTDLQIRLPNIDVSSEPSNSGLLKTTNNDPILDRKARVTISVSLPQFDGSKSQAAKFVSKFTHLATTQNFPETEWDALLMDCLKKDALKHFESSRRKFSTHKHYFKDLIQFFDNRSVLDEKKWYRDTFRQNQKEPIRTFYLRFLQTIEHLQNLDIFPADDHITFHSTFMDDFFGKLNDECYLIVDNKLRDSNRSPQDVTHTSFFGWVDTALKYNNSVHTLAKSVKQTSKEHKNNKKRFANHSGTNNGNQTSSNANNKPSPALSKQDRVCYWCEKRGHTHKAEDKKTWTCPDYLAGKEPCASWVAFQASKGYPPQNA